MIEQLDMFAESVPQFRMRGRKTNPTICGGLTTFAIFIILASYSTIKLSALIDRHNPNITSFIDNKGMPDDYRVMLKD